MKKLILNWLFGTDNVDIYMEILEKYVDCNRRYLNAIDDHIKTLKRDKEHIEAILRLIKICENHGIDIDKELKQTELIPKEE